MTKGRKRPNGYTGWMTQRTMTGDDYLEAIRRLGLDNVQAGRFLGINERHSRRYTKDEIKVPVPTVLLLRALLAMRSKPWVPPV